MTLGPVLGSKLTPGTVLSDYLKEPLVRLMMQPVRGYHPDPFNLFFARVLKVTSNALAFHAL